MSELKRVKLQYKCIQCKLHMFYHNSLILISVILMIILFRINFLSPLNTKLLDF